MFSLYRLEDLAELASKGLFRLNSKILKALGKQIANARNGSFDRISLLSNADREADRLLLEILKELNIATAKASEIYAQAAKLAYQDMNKYYAARGLTQIPIDQQRAIVNFVQGIAATTRETFANLSNTTAIGFRVLGLDGKVRYKVFRRHYYDLVDQSITEVATGQIDYRSAFRHAMRQTADSGIRIIDYESGYSRRLDSAMRQNILDGVKEIAHEVSKQTGEQFGADGVEISAHNNCAPDHLPYQGRQFSKQEFEDIQESLHREFGMWNCRHTIFPIILGLSEPLYTEEERQQMITQSTAVKEFEGKSYTAYEATQLQRKIETEIRKRKDRAILAKEAGDDIGRRVEQLKINQLQDKYLELSKTFELPLAKDRMTVAGFRPVAVNTSKRADLITKIQNLSSDQVIILGNLNPNVVSKWTTSTNNNLELVLTGKQRIHYLDRHPEMTKLEPFLLDTVLSPDEVHRNAKDEMMALFYRKVDNDHYMRVAVLLQEVPNEKKHSIMSFRIATEKEVEKMKRMGRVKWVK